jgi:5-methylcytosine-specific restriction endonuclease McrA
MMRRNWTMKVMLQKHRGLCHLCKQTVSLGDEGSPRYATIDHVIPLSRGGKDHIDNLALACRECNERKGAS